jgi:hypothetical protein
MTLSIMTFSKTTLGITMFSTTTHSIIIFGKITYCIVIETVRVSIFTLRITIKMRQPE